MTYVSIGLGLAAVALFAKCVRDERRLERLERELAGADAELARLGRENFDLATALEKARANKGRRRDPNDWWKRGERPYGEAG